MAANTAASMGRPPICAICGLDYWGKHGTRSSSRTRRNAITASLMSPPFAAACN
jgi:hypothetical protein